MPKLVLIIHNVRSAHNVGSLLRSADGLGVTKVYLSGYSPYPTTQNDNRLPHQAAKIHRRIEKTSLGAETSVNWQHINDINRLISKLRTDKFQIAALEQNPKSKALDKFRTSKPTALIVGSERDGLPDEIIAKCDLVLEIPMLGQKESFNVAVAGAMALYHLRYRA